MTSVAPISEEGGPLVKADPAPAASSAPLLDEEGEPLYAAKPYQRVLYRIPVINLLFEMFFDGRASFDQVEKFIATISLVDALLLAVAMAGPMTFDYDSLVDMDERLATGYLAGYFRSPVTSSTQDAYFPFSHQIMTEAVLATNFLGASLIMAVITYMVISTADMHYKFVGEAMWPSIRWLLLAMFVFTFTGVISTLNMFSAMSSAIYPNYYILTEMSQDWVLDKWRDLPLLGYDENWEYVVTSMRATFFTATFFTVLVLSWSVYQKARAIDRRAIAAGLVPAR